MDAHISSEENSLLEAVLQSLEELESKHTPTTSGEAQVSQSAIESSSSGTIEDALMIDESPQAGPSTFQPIQVIAGPSNISPQREADPSMALVQPEAGPSIDCAQPEAGPSQESFTPLEHNMANILTSLANTPGPWFIRPSNRPLDPSLPTLLFSADQATILTDPDNLETDEINRSIEQSALDQMKQRYEIVCEYNESLRKDLNSVRVQLNRMRNNRDHVANDNMDSKVIIRDLKKEVSNLKRQLEESELESGQKSRRIIGLQENTAEYVAKLKERYKHMHRMASMTEDHHLVFKEKLEELIKTSEESVKRVKKYVPIKEY